MNERLSGNQKGASRLKQRRGNREGIAEMITTAPTLLGDQPRLSYRCNRGQQAIVNVRRQVCKPPFFSTSNPLIAVLWSFLVFVPLSGPRQVRFAQPSEEATANHHRVVSRLGHLRKPDLLQGLLAETHLIDGGLDLISCYALHDRGRIPLLWDSNHASWIRGARVVSMKRTSMSTTMSSERLTRPAPLEMIEAAKNPSDLARSNIWPDRRPGKGGSDLCERSWVQSPPRGSTQYTFLCYNPSGRIDLDATFSGIEDIFAIRLDSRGESS